MLIREDSHGDKVYDITFAFCPVQLPDIARALFLVVVSGFGAEPMMLLTNVALRKNRAVLCRMVEAYHTRWKIEETIRFLKQSC